MGQKIQSSRASDPNWQGGCARLARCSTAVDVVETSGELLEETREYRRWSAYAAEHGRSEAVHVEFALSPVDVDAECPLVCRVFEQAHPTTPRAGEQTSKREFEVKYAKWRVQLRLDSSGAESLSASGQHTGPRHQPLR